MKLRLIVPLRHTWTMTPRELLEAAFRVAVGAAAPHELERFLPPLPAGRLLVLGAGKAAAAMTQAVEAHYPLDRLEGLVIVPYGHALPTNKIDVVEAAHPVPDEAGVKATRRGLELAQKLGQDDLLLCLLSGGGSALLCAPDGITLAQKAALTQALLRSGATIQEINTVRKHLSSIKGGRLAAVTRAPVHSLMLSDVVGDDLASIASGPTVADPSTFADALEIMKRYGLDFPEARQHLDAGVRGDIPETPKPGDALFERAKSELIASNQKSLEAVAHFFAAQGVTPHILSSTVIGEARASAKFHAALVRQIKTYAQPFAPPCVLISGGETTVTVQGQGRGGRNSEFLLALALELNGLAGVHALAADTDGIDGSEANAGASYGPGVFKRVSEQEARALLAKNDSYTFFERAGTLLITGPTHTNVNDLRIIILSVSSR